ncbi:MAG TPA: sigma 54-interacting transcriptional regulator, partial [Gammaproteobacteria bacterium]|nr:sigma 54-interacting transcriptional regulator [Gammaproteobacteria bacterium]
MPVTTAPADAVRRILDSEDCGALLDVLVDGVIIVGAGGRVRAANRCACELLGIDTHAVGQSAQTLLATFSADGLASSYDPAHPRRQEFVLRGADGRTVLIAERVCRDSGGVGCYTLLILRDLQLLDHQRRSASGLRDGNVFKFLSDRGSGPDFDVQRRLSPKLDQAIGRGARALRQGAHLLLIGESGSGKTELARQLHRTVGAPEEPFVHVNCAAIPETLFESEMFGYEKGAFTGALHSGKRGLLEGADGGTLFLDEVSEIPLPLQAKLLKFLEDGEVQRVGGQQTHAVRTRIVSASNQDLWRLVDSGLFRADLYYRLAVITVPVAPLREQPA